MADAGILPGTSASFQFSVRGLGFRVYQNKFVAVPRCMVQGVIEG